MSNRVFKINGQFNLINKAQRKLIWLSLPQLVPITKYYTRSNFIQIMGSGSFMIIDKNAINCITVNLPPLSLNLYKQDILDWQPTGGISLSTTMILYDKHTINFYQSTQTLTKTWTIQVMQQITQIQSSKQQKILGMMVKQKTNTIFLWNLHDIANKSFQQINISQPIIKWQFYNQQMLVILTNQQLQVYFPQYGKYSLYFFIQLHYHQNNNDSFANLINYNCKNSNILINGKDNVQHKSNNDNNNSNNVKKNNQIFIDFCFLDRPKTNDHTGRRSVYPVAILSNEGNLIIYQLYDIDKRIKNSQSHLIKVLQCPKDTQSIICGFEKQQSQIIICGQSKSTKPFTFVLNSNFDIIKKYQFLPQLNTQNSKSIQYCKDIICTNDQYVQNLQNVQNTSQNQIKFKQYRLYKIIGKQQFQFIQSYISNGFTILGGYNFFIFNTDNIQIYKKSQNFAKQQKILVQNIKLPKNIFLLQQKQNIAYFISGIKLFRLDLINKTFKNHNFTIKNDKLTLLQVRNQTRSILYKLNQQYILIQYTTPHKPQLQSEKTTIKTIKTSQNTLISLRNGRWAQRKIDCIVIGQGNKILVQFDLAKFFKQLTQQTTLLDYNIYWTTHNGILLKIKNYIFVLQLTQSTDGYSIALVKRSNNYLHIRLNPDIDDLQIMDARNAIIKQGKRIMKLGNQFGNFVSEDPYQLPDTLLRRQLLMRKMYPPHHPKVIQYLIQLGQFTLLEKLFENLWNWTKQNPTMSQLYNRIGIDFYKQFNSTSSQTNIIIPQSKQLNLDQQQLDKKLCELILQNPQLLNLQQNGSLILQSQIQALIFKQQNSRSIDLYSSTILTQYKTFYGKSQQFTTMNIAFMLHSINKQQAINILHQQKKQIDWDWIKKFSITIWYQNKIHLQNWAEQIGTNLFKINKDPMDCLFWYTVSNKKHILIQLFKKYNFNSPEHQAIFKFLQRDFSQPKHQNAAVKNAYALIDKKRYFHALAFFIYGKKLDQAISLCLNKLRDINLAFLICKLNDDTINRNKLLDILIKQGDIWSKHIAYFYRNQHINSFNCLFQQQNIQIINNWVYQPKLTNFHPSIKLFAQMIQKSIPLKRQLQTQQISIISSQPQDIFSSFYQQKQQPTVNQQINEKKQLQSNYQFIKKQSITYFIRNNCSILALMLQPTNYNAKRSYDLCHFMQTKQVNTTVCQLIQQMEDYQSIIKSLSMAAKSIKQQLFKFYHNFKNVFHSLQFTSITIAQKGKIGQLMHYSYLASKILLKIKNKQYRLQQPSNHILKSIQSLLDISIIYFLLQLQLYKKIQQLITYLIISNNTYQKQNYLNQQFWQLLKIQYNKINQFKKNKKQNLYDSFQQILYKYMYKKNQLTHLNNCFKLSTEHCVSIFIKKICIQSFIFLLNQKNFQQQSLAILQSLHKTLTTIFYKYSQQNANELLTKQLSIMLTQGISSQIKLHYFPTYLSTNFQPLCLALISFKSKQFKSQNQKISTKPTLNVQKINKTQVIEIFRNKNQIPRFFTINKNQGTGIQILLTTKKNVKKFQICQSLINRNRSQDGITLLNNQDIINQNDTPFNFNSIFQNPHPPIIQKFLISIMDNRKQYDGMGIIRGSTKRSSTQYLKSHDTSPAYQISDINCIQCHHFLPIYMLGVKSSIQLCLFEKKQNFNRIKCPTMNDIIKIKSYQQRVTVLDSSGNLSSYSFDSKVSGNCVFQLKKQGIIDFCPMTPTTYGLCTSSAIQVIDTLVHPKRQIVFKTPINQAPIAISYFQQHKLIVCRKSDLQFYDIRKDILESFRDLAGKSKCMVSNYRDHILVGKSDNKVRVIDLISTTNAQDYDIKCINSYKLNDTAPDKASIQSIDILGKLAIALNSQGTMSIFSIE